MFTRCPVTSHCHAAKRAWFAQPNRFAQLAKHNLSFDCQINPHQLQDAATFFASRTSVPVRHCPEPATLPPCDALPRCTVRRAAPMRTGARASIHRCGSAVQHACTPQVVLNHAGCLKLDPEDFSTHAAQISVWEAGMQALAKLPHVHVKLSQPCYTLRVRQASCVQAIAPDA